MTPQEINVKLQTMKERSFNYGNKLHIVKSFKINKDDEDFLLVTDQGRFKRTFKQAPDFFKHWFETKENLAQDAIKEQLKNSEPDPGEQTTENNAVVIFSEAKTDNLANDLIKLLQDNITKVSNNPGYIKQAQVIDKSVGTILNVKRMQLEMYKALKSTKNGKAAEPQQ
jgi:hypothetical protein